MPAVENESQGMSTCWCSRIVGVAQLLFESSNYFVQHFRRCGDCLRARAVSDRANTVIILPIKFEVLPKSLKIYLTCIVVAKPQYNLWEA